MADDKSVLILDSQDNVLLKPLPFSGATSPVVPEIIDSTTREVGLQGSPVPRLMEPPNIDRPVEENSKMKHDTDDQIDKQNDSHHGHTDDDTVGTRDLPDPTVSPEDRKKYKVGVTELTHDEQIRISNLVQAEELARLSKEISSLYQQVENEIAESREHAAQAFTWLNDARRIVIASPGLYTLAELQIHQARLLLKQVKASDAAAKLYQRRLISWNLFWLVLFMLLFAFDGGITNWLINMGIVDRPTEFTSAEFTPTLVWYFQPWLCVLVGGIGGALAAITVLGRSISRREYDPALNLDYYLNAIKGAVLGGVVYYILLGGFITVASTTTINNNVADLVQRVQVAGSPLFILMGFMAGFAQQRILALLPQVWGNLTGEEKKTDDETLAVRQAAVNAVPLGVQSLAMGTRNQLPYQIGSYNGNNGNNGSPANYRSQTPDPSSYQNDPSSNPNGQDDFVPFANAGR